MKDNMIESLFVLAAASLAIASLLLVAIIVIAMLEALS